MATSKEYCDYVLECLSRVGSVHVRKMMGEYCLYSGGKVIGLICDNTLYLKQTPTTVRLLPNAPQGYPYEGSKTLMHIVEDAEDAETMGAVLAALVEEHPEPVPKKKGRLS